MKGRVRWRKPGIAVAIALCLDLVVAAGLASASAATVSRPLSDFLGAQRFPIGWLDPATGLFARVDYAGRMNAALVQLGGTSLGTTVLGSVTERPLADGRAEVTVVLVAMNAFTVVGIPGDTFTELLGHTFPNVLAGADAGLSTSMFKIVFINTAPGAPLPDVVDVIFLPLPGQQLVSISIATDGSGTLRAAFGVPEGTQGRAQVTQTGLFITAFRGATADGFPAEHIKLQAVGS